MATTVGSAASPTISWADMSDHTDDELELESMHPSQEKQQQKPPPAEPHQGMRRVPSDSERACSTPSTSAPSSPRTSPGTPSSTHDVSLLPVPNESQRIVVNVGNLPSNIRHRNDLLQQLIFALGFKRTDVRMLYCKFNFKKQKPEYAWIAFENHDLARKFWETAEARGYQLTWVQDCRPLPDYQLQDLQSVAALKQWFESNSIMHQDIRSDLQPCFYEAGKEVPFFSQQDLRAPKKQVLKEIGEYLKHFPDVPSEVISASPENENESSWVIKNTFLHVPGYNATCKLLHVPVESVRSIATLFYTMKERWNSGKVTDEDMKDAQQEIEEAEEAGKPKNNSW